MTLTKTTRSVRNCNPGNIERSHDNWLGLATLPEMTADQRNEQTFCVFRDARYGFRALAIDLHSKWDKDGLKTIRQIIGKFAPPNENDTEAYINCVSRDVGVNPDVALDLDNEITLRKFCRAIACHEAGGWHFADTDLETGVQWAWSSRHGALT